METPSNHRRSSSANDAITPTSHRRIPFVHRLSSFRRNHHNRGTSSSSQLSSSLSDTTNTTKPKDDILSSDLILKVAIVRGRSLAREDEVYTKKRKKNSCVTFASLFYIDSLKNDYL